MGGKTSMYKLFFVFLILLSSNFCAKAKTSYFGEESWSGLSFDGKEVVFRDLDVSEIAINVYSPDCVPCYKEIPSLNLLAEEIEKHPKKAFFLVVDPKQILPDSDPNISFAESYQLAKVRMLEEVKNRNIKAKVLFMKPNFQVGTNSLVTGTPETILMETKPLRIYYNFIGSISEKSNPTEIKNESKYQFFRHQFGLSSL
jgi:thiol-disulfide isomerase/thioredoxin